MDELAKLREMLAQEIAEHTISLPNGVAAVPNLVAVVADLIMDRRALLSVTQQLAPQVAAHNHRLELLKAYVHRRKRAAGEAGERRDWDGCDTEEAMVHAAEECLRIMAGERDGVPG